MPHLPPVIALLVLLLLAQLSVEAPESANFTFNGFGPADVHTDGIAAVLPGGLLRLTNTTKLSKGHAFYPTPIHFKNSTTSRSLSFSTTFVFAMRPEYQDVRGHGIAFVVSPSADLSTALPSQFMGLFNSTDNGDSSNRIVAVELDNNYNPEFGDIDDDHVGIDVNSLRSVNSSHASYFSRAEGRFRNLSLVSGEAMQTWVEYDQSESFLNVTLAPIAEPKPQVPLLSCPLNLSSLISEYMFVGFSSSAGSYPTSHYILGWSFSLNGRASPLDLSRLPSLPRLGPKPKPKLLIIGLPAVAVTLLLSAMAGAGLAAWRRIKYAELLEDWETEYGPQRFSYKDLHKATKGFRERELVGAGGFGRVYKGVLPSTNAPVAVKKVSHESRQGMRQFVAEIFSIGRLRHRNLVQLLGYCRRRGELLLVYDFMPNGSLDRVLFDKDGPTLSWGQRLHIIRGVAAGLFYLHEEWGQVVIHRDIKASNILLDAELNGRLGDFGLARLYDHGTDPQTTHVVGTLGYLAPELPRTGKATTATDVYAFGGFLLEVACGRRPIETRASPEEMILVDWVLERWRRGTVVETRDPNLGNDYDLEEMELVLKLGLLCSHPRPAARPGMRLVVQVLEGCAPLPELVDDGWDDLNFAMAGEGFDGYGTEVCTSVDVLVDDSRGSAVVDRTGDKMSS